MVRTLTLVAVVASALTSACAAGPAGRPVPQPFPRPGATPAPSETETLAAPPAGLTEGYAIAGTALALRGVPYRNGGGDPSGFDCSGFVWYVFARHHITVPRTVADQYRAGQPVGTSLGAGDLLFFNTTGSGPSHVGIAIGGDEFVHAPSSTGEVRVERLGSSYWSARFVGARRLL